MSQIPSTFLFPTTREPKDWIQQFSLGLQRQWAYMAQAFNSSQASGVHNVNDYGAIGDDSTDNVAFFEAALDAAEDAGGGTIYIPFGTYRYTTSPNWARAGVSIQCEPGAILKHTGTGNAFILDGGEAGSGILGNRYDNITVQGNANSTNGWYIRAMHHCIFNFPRCTGCATTGSGFLLEWCVVNQWNTPRVSVNEATLSPIPLHGMKLTRRGSGSEHTTAETITNPIMEGLTNANGAGLYYDYTNYNCVVCGTSESNTNGVILTANASYNNFYGIDFESNTDDDIYCQGFYNAFYGVNANGSTHIASGGNGNSNTFVGGVYDDFTIDSGCLRNHLIGMTYGSSGGTFTDNGTSTLKLRVLNADTTNFEAPSAERTVSTRFEATYDTTVTIDARVAAYHIIVPDDGVGFTIAAPTNGANGQWLTVHIRNTTGGALGAATWNAAYKLATWTQPATGFSRAITFQYNGTSWEEMNRTTSDIPN